MGQACFRCIERDDDPNLLKAPRQVATAKAHLVTDGPLLKCSDGIVDGASVEVRRRKIRNDNVSWHSFGTIRSAMSEEDIRDQDKIIDEYMSPHKNIKFTYSPRVQGKHWRNSGRASFTGDDMIDTEWDAKDDDMSRFGSPVKRISYFDSNDKVQQTFRKSSPLNISATVTTVTSPGGTSKLIDAVEQDLQNNTDKHNEEILNSNHAEAPSLSSTVTRGSGEYGSILSRSSTIIGSDENLNRMVTDDDILESDTLDL
eukprot:jgi/Bigna1/134403/aug1.25_g9111